MNPATERVPNRGFRRGTNNEFFFEFCSWVYHHPFSFGIGFEAIVGDHSTFFGKALNVVSFFGKIALGDEHREVSILHTGSLKTSIQILLNALPNGIAIRFNHHTAAHIGLFGKVCFHHQFVVPARVIYAAFGQIFEFFCHSIFLFFFF